MLIVSSAQNIFHLVTETSLRRTLVRGLSTLNYTDNDFGCEKFTDNHFTDGTSTGNFTRDHFADVNFNKAIIFTVILLRMTYDSDNDIRKKHSEAINQIY